MVTLIIALKLHYKMNSVLYILKMFTLPIPYRTNTIVMVFNWKCIQCVDIKLWQNNILTLKRFGKKNVIFKKLFTVLMTWFIRHIFWGLHFAKGFVRRNYKFYIKFHIVWFFWWRLKSSYVEPSIWSLTLNVFQLFHNSKITKYNVKDNWTVINYLMAVLIWIVKW